MTQKSPLIGIMSDSHDQVHYLERVIHFFNEQTVEFVVHCGDWISPFTLSYFKSLNAPLYGVFGNNDGEKFGHTKVAKQLELDLTIEDQLLTLNKFEKRFAIYHGTAPKIVEALAKCGDYDVVFYGHNHQAKIEMFGNTLVMNPGTLLDVTNKTVQGSSIGLYDPHNHSGQIIKINELPH